MFRTIALTGATAAVIIGAGTAAIATTGSSGASTTAGRPAAAAAAAKAGKTAGRARLGQVLRRAVHAQVVTKGKNGTFVTHDEIRGTVDAVSATSITITAADTTKQTYAVNSATKVRVRSGGTGKTASAAPIGSVHVGDGVIVLGTGSATLTATHIVDGLAKK